MDKEIQIESFFYRSGGISYRVEKCLKLIGVIGIDASCRIDADLQTSIG